MDFPSKPLTQLLGSNGPVHALTYSSSPSTYILTGSSDRTIRLYNPSRPCPTPSSSSTPLSPPKPTQLIQSYSAHGYEVLSLTVASDNATFASAGGDRAVFLWDVATAKTLRRFQGHTARVNAVTFAAQGDSVLVSGSFDASVRLWDVRSQSGKPVMVLDDARDSVTCVLVSREGGGGRGGGGMGEYEVLAGSVDGRVRCYDLRFGRVETDVIGASVTSLERTRDGKGVLVGGLDSCVRLMDREGGGLLKSYKGAGWRNEEFRLRSVFGKSERWVLCGNEDVKGADGEVVVWDTLSGEVVERVRVEGSKVEAKRKIGTDGKERERKNVVSCLAWKDGVRGDQWCCAGTDGIVTIFGPP
ncbi:uncharacterized protein L3040_001156 [Drepanopeziza brunnea f. sp. 'multigermtubi']|uniref:uncharacterized protein n=1 Tax=Drepanopeziza brunnea f. sp. 'multigermtubi' TaxID=698441 RepID=UPI0023922709|nr:hypothetical protein L3040_001156 [Drepanopeziza brunnea f. sp. 'multigermtubi']